MENTYIKNVPRVVEQISRFITFVQEADGGFDTICFGNRQRFLGREEGYKTLIVEKTREEMRIHEWKESWVGTGRINQLVRKAIGKSGNLVNKNQQIGFGNILDPNHEKHNPEAERLLYDIYCNDTYPDSKAFTKAISIFGAKYDLISFLFFAKDYNTFLPISPGHFDKAFRILDIDCKTAYRCSWENYIEFINVITELYELLQEKLPLQGQLRLIDAHSFVWVLQEERFINWKPDEKQKVQIEQNAEAIIQDVYSGREKRRNITSSVFARSITVVNITKERAKGICQLCDKPAPFHDKKGNPYLEVHHVRWLSRGGEDSTNNTAALYDYRNTMMVRYYGSISGISGLYRDNYPYVFEEIDRKLLLNEYSDFFDAREELEKRLLDILGDEEFIRIFKEAVKYYQENEKDNDREDWYWKTNFPYCKAILYPLYASQAYALRKIMFFQNIEIKYLKSLSDCRKYIDENLGLKDEYADLMARCGWEAYGPSKNEG